MWKIYHNPKCSKSRRALEILKENEIIPEVIEYLNDPPSLDTLQNLSKALNVPPKLMLRTKEDVFKGLDLDIENGQAVLEAIVQHPKLLERPIVLHRDKAVIARPPEKVEGLF